MSSGTIKIEARGLQRSLAKPLEKCSRRKISKMGEGLAERRAFRMVRKTVKTR